jgi:hypothetical protein
MQLDIFGRIASAATQHPRGMPPDAVSDAHRSQITIVSAAH